MVNVYLSGSDARNAAADLWQSDQLKRVNDQFAPPPADTAQPLPSAPVEAAGDQGSALPSAAGPALTQPAPPAAVPQPAPVLPAAPNPTPDRNDLADHFTRNAIADAWEQNAISDVTKGVSQAGAGVQSALADVPKEAQGLVSNLAALPGASAGIPAPQPTQSQVATVAGGQPPTAGSVQAATATTAGISGGGDLSGRIGDRGMQIMASGAQAASWLGGEGQKALQAVLLTEGGLAGARGDQGKSAGPLQFYEGGQLANFAQQMGLGLEQAKQYVEAHPEAAIQWAIGTPDRPGYLGGAIQAGLKAGLTGADLATYAQRHGQVSVSPERAGQNWQSLFGSGQTAVAQAPSTDQTVASTGGPTRLDRTSQFQLGLNDADAYAACGPAAAIAFARAFGRNPTSQEALQLAKQSGWTQGGGMNGVVNEKKLMDAMGVPTTLETTVNWSKITSDAQNGNPVIVSTPGHYFTVDDAKQAQDGSTLYHVGTSGTDLRGGSEWMSAGEIQRRMGTANGALFADHPQASGPSLAEQAAGVVRSVAAPVQQKAQDILSAVGNVGSAIGTTASNIGGALTSPNLPGQIYQNSPIGAFNTATQQIGQNVVSPALEAITQPGGPLVGPRTAAAGALENAASSVPSGVPVVAGALQHAAGFVGGPTVIDQIGMVQDLANKYPSAVPGLPDVNRMTPQDQAQWSNLMVGVGGIVGGEGAGAAERMAARGLPPNEPLATGAQPGQLGFGTELPLGGPRPVGGEAVGPVGPQPGQLQIGSELPIGGSRPTGTEPLAPGARPGQMQFGSELPMGGPPPTGSEALGPAGAQRGQMQIGSELPVGGPRPAGTEPLAPGAQPGQFQIGSELPLGGPAPTGTEAQGAAGPLVGQMRLPGFPNPQTATPLELFRAYHTGNVVSSPATAVHVALNSVISPVWSLGTHSVADLLGGSLNAVTGAPTGNLGRAIGRGSAVGSAMAEFGRNLAQGFSEFYANPANVANKIDNPLASGLLKAQQAVGAALHSSFQNASQAATARLELAAEAGERAWAEGARGQELMNRIGELMTDPTPQMVARAQDVGTRAALRGSAGATQQVMQKIAEIPFIGNTLFPVVRIGAQSIAQGVEKSPLGLVGTGFDVARAAAGKGPYAGAGGFSQVGGAVTPLADRLTNNLAGTALTTFLTFKALDGTITGNGPDDPKARSMLQSQGWQPNSVYVPGRGYMDYHALGPLAIPFSIAGNIGDSILYSKPQPGESGGDQVKAATLDLTRRVADYLASGTGMRTIGDMWNLIHGGANAGAVGAQFAGSVAGGFVPLSAAVRAGVSSTDPFQRRPAASNVQQIVQQELPGGTPLIGGRQDLPIRQDVLGRPEANPQRGIGTVLPRTGTGQPDPMLMLLSRAGIELPATAPKTISYSGRQIQLTPDEQQQRQTLFGQRLQQTLQGYLKSDKFQALSPDQQYKALEPVVRAASTYADQRLIGEMPAADRKARMATAPRAYGAGVVPYLAAGSNGGLASLIARQSGAEADAAHQRLIAQYSSQPAQPQLAAVS